MKGWINPNRFPFFYGWIVLAVATFGMLMSAPGQTIGVSAFTNHLIEAMDVSRVDLSLAYMLGTIASACLLTRAGRLYDRYGARITGTLAGICLGAVLVMLSQIDRLTAGLDRLIPFVDYSWLAFALLAAGFLGLRFFGQGFLTLVSRNMLMKWFDRRRGLVNAVLGTFIAFGFSAAPKVFDSSIEAISWRATWLLMGLFIGIIFTTTACVFYRDNPRKYGLRPDGALEGPSHGARSKHHLEKDYDLHQARRCYSFWVFLGGLSLFALYNTALAFHVVSIFDMSGMDKDQATMIFIPGAFIAVAGNIVFSWLSDYVKLKYILHVLLASIALSSGAMFFLREGIPVTLIIVGNGMMAAVFGLLMSVTWPRFFGLTHLGSISGFAMGFIVASSAVGPYLFSLSKRFSNSYRAGALACFVAGILLLICSFRAENPNG